MVPVKKGHYEYQFDPNILKALRIKLSLSQAKLAEMLDVPPNTLSRWETGSTAPDANALAAIYSIAKRKNLTPAFFVKQGGSTPKKQRTKLLLAWDFQNLGLDSKYVEFEWKYMIRYLKYFHSDSRANQILRAYISPHQRASGEILDELNFDVNEGYFDADSQLARDSIDDCAQNPQKWTYVLATNDGDYTQMFKDLQTSGVDTYLWATDECSERLKNAVKEDRFIHWDAPYVVMTCIDVIKNLKGKQITRSQFGQLCKEALDEEECYPDEVGFSRKNPYGSILRWLERQEVIKVSEKAGKSDKVLIVVQGNP